MYSMGKNTLTRAAKMVNNWNPAYSKHLRKLSIALSDPSGFVLGVSLVEDLAAKLADTLDMISKAATRLETLRIEIEGYRMALFQAAFAARGLMFPHVRRLIVSPSNHYMVDHCPNTTMLAGSDRFGPFGEPKMALVEKAAALPDLECFALRTLWDGALLRLLGHTAMRVRTLLIAGSLGTLQTYESLSEPLLLLPSVEVLSIPTIVKLDAGIDTSNEDDDTENSARQRREAEGRVASFVFDRCPGLKELWFDNAIQVTRIQGERRGSEDGSDGLVWSRAEEIEPPPWVGLI
ncbi:hypothetical protein BDW22DRAFT_1433361 [Trametopsis cervina]|nr:hypothetical protein BDW22DRAFT_1433361 [Trametopsis cervina]